MICCGWVVEVNAVGFGRTADCNATKQLALGGGSGVGVILIFIYIQYIEQWKQRTYIRFDVVDNLEWCGDLSTQMNWKVVTHVYRPIDSIVPKIGREKGGVE